MPSLAKTIAAGALSWSGLNAWLGRKPRAMPLILGYHRVVESIAAMGELTLPAMMVSQGTLRAHLEWVGRRFRVVSLDELGALLERKAPCGHLAAITFDDGYRDVHDYALPVLQQMGVPAAVFVVSSLIRTKSPPLHDQLYQLVSEASAAKGAMPAWFLTALDGHEHDRHGGPNAMMQTVRTLLGNVPAAHLRRMLEDVRAQGTSTPPPGELATADWEALMRMQRAGIIIGSHTHTHALLDREDDATVLEELQRSRSEIEAGLGVPVHHFAYPDGRFSPRVVRAVAAAGYRFAYTICDHRDADSPLLTIPRVMLWEGSCTGTSGRFSPSLMDCHATSLLPFPSRCCDDHGPSSKRLSC
jgi:peptidoglycan/xylan/chitin deacetylase (PgdA/CDA1 family)